jgi:hypothetical protein
VVLSAQATDAGVNSDAALFAIADTPEDGGARLTTSSRPSGFIEQGQKRDPRYRARSSSSMAARRPNQARAGGPAPGHDR